MKKGSITIYISLVFVSVLLLISIVIESTRINVVQTECKSFTYLAADSVLAGYVRQVYEDYGMRGKKLSSHFPCVARMGMFLEK